MFVVQRASFSSEWMRRFSSDRNSWRKQSFPGDTKHVLNCKWLVFVAKRGSLTFEGTKRFPTTETQYQENDLKIVCGSIPAIERRFSGINVTCVKHVRKSLTHCIGDKCLRLSTDFVIKCHVREVQRKMGDMLYAGAYLRLSAGCPHQMSRELRTWEND